MSEELESELGDSERAVVREAVREARVPPHQCRCVVFHDLEESRSESRCDAWVTEGPDAPICERCEALHWGTNWERRDQYAQTLGHRVAGADEV